MLPTQACQQRPSHREAILLSQLQVFDNRILLLLRQEDSELPIEEACPVRGQPVHCEELSERVSSRERGHEVGDLDWVGQVDFSGVGKVDGVQSLAGEAVAGGGRGLEISENLEVHLDWHSQDGDLKVSSASES